jgi:truncated hemoglobin YjbI
MKWRTLRAACMWLLPFALGFAGCSSDDDDDGATTPPDETSPPGAQPSISIDSPTGGDVDQPFTVTISVENFTLDPAAGPSETNEAGKGHWHLHVDGEYFNFSTATTLEVIGLTQGSHKLKAELVNKNHASFSPAIFSNEVTVNALETVIPPDIEILEPADGTEVEGEFDLVVEVSDFILTPPQDENEDGHGHYHVYVDNVYQGFSAEETFTLGPLEAGAHQIQVTLAQNDHFDLEPLVSDVVEITAKEPPVSDDPTIEIVSPASGTTINSSSSPLEVKIENFTLDPEGSAGGVNAQGRGQFLIFVDNLYQSASASSTAVVTGLGTGTHDITVKLADNKGDPLEPAVQDSVLIKISGTAPKIFIDSPTNESALNEANTLLNIRVENFILDAGAIGGANVPGRGHYKVSVNGQLHGYGATPTYELKGLAPGRRNIWVELVQNDNSSLDPAVTDLVGINVQNTLYVRLGGEEGVTTVINDFVGRVLEDSKINGYFLNSRVDGGRLTNCLVKFVGNLAGGPQQYPSPSGDPDGCRDMKTAHLGMGISGNDYGDLAGHLVGAMDDAGVAQADIDAVVAALTQPDFVDDIVEDPNSNETIYQRVGRKPAIEVVINDFIGRVVSDSKINGYFLNQGLDAERLGLCLVRQVCSLDGPCFYGEEVEDAAKNDAGEIVPCKDMVTVHKGLGISNNDYGDLAGHLVDALVAAGVTSDDVDALVDIFTDPGLVDAIVEDPNNNKTIYQRVGRKPAIEAVIGDFVGRVVGDSKINGYFLNSTVNAARLDLCLVRQVCSLDGPCLYGQEVEDAAKGPDGNIVPCRDMLSTHAGLGISSNDYNDLAGHLVGSLQTAGVSSGDVNALVNIFTDPGLVNSIVEDPNNNLTVYQRVGRKPAIETVIADFVERVAGDAKINGYFLNSTVDLERLDLCLIRQVCSIDGPCLYGKEVEEEAQDSNGNIVPCRDMLATHAGLGISQKDYDDLVNHLVAALQAAGVAAGDIAALGAVVSDPGFVDVVVEDPNSNLTVYQRVGRKPAIKSVVDDLIVRVVGDTSLVGFFGTSDVPRLTTCLTRQVCDIDGPCLYGKDEYELAGSVCGAMDPVHNGLKNTTTSKGISVADFDNLLAHLTDAMAAKGVSTSDRNKVVLALDPLCKDIVEDPTKCN